MKTVTVGIPAYNEEANIVNLLKSILDQQMDDAEIQQIIVLSDGSTDKTVEKVKQMNQDAITVWDFKERLGKSYHLNTFFERTNSDILVLFDADVILENNRVIDKLIKPLIKEKEVDIVSGNFQPIKVKGFIQEANKSTINAYEVVRSKFKNGHNVLGCTGRIMALSRNCYQSISIPPTMVLNDLYTYFAALKAGFNFRHVSEATVYYQLPTTFGDYVSQYKRFCVGSYHLKKIFGQLYEQEVAFDISELRSLMFREFVKRPAHCLAIFFINSVYRQLALNEVSRMDGRWQIAISTKTL